MDVQRARLLAAIVTAVQTSTTRSGSTSTCDALGRDHRKFHVEPEHYEVVGEALLEALRTFAGEQWGIEYDQAWRDAYDVIADQDARRRGGRPEPAVLARRGDQPRAPRPATSRCSPAGRCSRWSTAPAST